MHLEVMARTRGRRVEGDKFDLIEGAVSGDGSLLGDHSAGESDARCWPAARGGDDDGVRLDGDDLPFLLARERGARPEADDEGAEIARLFGNKVDGGRDEDCER